MSKWRCERCGMVVESATKPLNSINMAGGPYCSHWLQKDGKPVGEPCVFGDFRILEATNAP